MQRQLLQLRDRRVQLLDIFFHREGNRVNLLTRVVKRARPLRELRQPVQLLRRGVDGVTDARGSLVEHRFHLRRLVREMQRRASSFVVVVEIVVIQRRPELLLLLFLHVRGGGGGVKIRAFSFRRGAVLVVVFVSSPLLLLCLLPCNCLLTLSAVAKNSRVRSVPTPWVFLEEDAGDEETPYSFGIRCMKLIIFIIFYVLIALLRSGLI